MAELFDILLKHSLVGNLYTGDSWIESVFIDGLHKGFGSSAIVRELFTCRAGVLLAHRDSGDIFSYLSGLLIGNEIREGQGLLSMSDESDK